MPNFIAAENGELYFIDWEYAGLNYAANDLACIFCRGNFSEDEINRYMETYFGRELSDDEERFFWSFIPMCAFYWFCWGLYKGSVGDDDSFFFLPAYRNFNKYIDAALESYSELYSGFDSQKSEKEIAVSSSRSQKNIAIILAG